MDQRVAIAMAQIEDSDLSDKQYRAARRILDRAYTTGHLVMTQAETQAVCTTNSEGATRRLLGQLKAAGIINYHIGDSVFIGLTAWDDGEPRSLSDHLRAESDLSRAESDRGRSESDRNDGNERSESDHLRAESDHKRSLSARERSESDHATYTGARAHIGLVGLGNIINSTIEENKPNQTKPEHDASAEIDEHEQVISFGLLKASGIIPTNARRLAREHPLEEIQRAVGQWWDRRDEYRSAGIIVSWLDSPNGVGLPATSAAFERSALYRKWQMPDERNEPPPPVAPPPTPQAASAPIDDNGPLAQVWRSVIEATGPAAREWLADAHLRSVTDGCAVITAPARSAQYINNRLGNQIRRHMATAGCPVKRVRIQAAEAAESEEA